MLHMMIFFGCGAVTYLLAETLSGKKAENWYRAFAEWFAYAVCDQFLALLILLPTDKAAILTTAEGTQTVQFFIVGYGGFLLAAVAVGIFSAILKKKIQVEIEVEKSENTNEKEKNN